jgi:hypothetical protein
VKTTIEELREQLRTAVTSESVWNRKPYPAMRAVSEEFYQTALAMREILEELLELHAPRDSMYGPACDACVDWEGVPISHPCETAEILNRLKKETA